MARPGWEAINAYVDGELSALEAAQVAAAVAQDRELAAQVAILARLKAQTTALRREPERTQLPAGNGRRRWILSACAGTVLAAAILAGLVLVPWDTRQTTPAWLQAARIAHAQWVRQGIDGDGLHGAAAAGAARAFGVPWVPDLRAIDLRQHSVHRGAAGHTGVVHVGYTGPRGCMLSFLTWPDEHGLSPEPRRFGEGAEAAWAWRVGDVGYLLLATRMAPERLAVVVEVVHEATLKRLPPGPDAQRQYLASRRSTAPCQT
jgi:MFS family permease